MNFLNSKLVAVAGLIAVVTLGFFVARRMPILYQTRQEMTHIQKEITALKERRADLEQKKEYYQSEDYQEYQARLKLHYKNPDEKAVYVYRSTVPTEQQVSVDKGQSNLRLWLDYLFSNSRGI